MRISLSPESVAKMDLEQSAQMKSALMVAAQIAASRGLILMQSRTRSAIPASPRGSAGAFDTGAFLRAWRMSPDPDGAAVINSAPYAGVIELGRRPGTSPPPVEPIAQWLLRKVPSLKKPGGRSVRRLDAVRSIAFKVAQAIGRRGLRGRMIVTGAMQELSKYLKDEVDTMVQAVLSGRWGKQSSPSRTPKRPDPGHLVGGVWKKGMPKPTARARKGK